MKLKSSPDRVDPKISIPVHGTREHIDAHAELAHKCQVPQIIKPKNGLGGLGGSIVKPVGLSNVNMFSNNTRFDIIGCGGISTCEDAFEHILCGASAVQIGTAFYKNKNIFNKIVNNFVPFIKDKNYNKINEFKGQIKNINI